MHEPVKQDELMQCLAAVGAGERALADDDYARLVHDVIGGYVMAAVSLPA